MDPHVIVLDAKRDREFLEQQRIDPVMKTSLEPGDRVVVCAHCRLVFREYTWAEIKGKFGHGTSTLPYLPVDSVQFSRAANREERPPAERATTTDPAPSYASPPSEARHVRTGEPQLSNGPSAAEQAWWQLVNRTRQFSDRVRGRSRRTDSSDTEVLELKEIPFELKKIPFELREMKLY